MKRFVRVGKMTQVFKIQVLVAGDKFITLNMEGVYQKVQKVMRHTKFATTQRYIHVDADSMLEAVNKIAKDEDSHA